MSHLVLRRVRIVEQILADDELVSLLLLRRVALPLVEESTVVCIVSERKRRVAPIARHQCETHVVKISAVATTRRLLSGKVSTAQLIPSARVETYSEEV